MMSRRSLVVTFKRDHPPAEGLVYMSIAVITVEEMS